LTLTSRSLKVPNFSDYKLIKYVWHTSIIDWEENLQENAIFDDKYYGFWKKNIRNPYAPRNADAWILAYSQLRIWHVGTFPADW
jgi:hypothetical protein